MTAIMTKTELFDLLPASGNAETEQARGRFLAALRLAEALTPSAIIHSFVAWRERRRTAAALASLPDAVLRDIGLTRTEIARAAEAAVTRPAVPSRDGAVLVRPALARAA